MSDTTFPSPPAMQQPVPPPSRDLLTFTMLEALRSTKPWVRFLSILGFISSGFLILIGIGVAVFGAYQMATGTGEGALLIGLGLLYALFALLYIIPSLYLFRYANAIRDAIAAPSKAPAIERALEHQKSFWKFAGIMALIMLLLYIPGVIAAIAIPNLLTALQRSEEKRTMSDIRSIATAVEAYAVDYGGYPEVGTIEELATALEPYIGSLPLVDGWGSAYHYQGLCNDGSCTSYVIASGGKNLELERSSPADYAGDSWTPNISPDEDIVYSLGAFIRGPEGSGG
jgi:type II secretory pathway pseudopilin PulG